MKLERFLEEEREELYAEIVEATWIAEDLGEEKILSFYPDSLYHAAEQFLEEYPSEKEEVFKRIDKDYVRRQTGKEGEELVVEALASLVLREYQTLREWQSIYGAGHKVLFDFIHHHDTPLKALIEGDKDYYHEADIDSDCDLDANIPLPASYYDVLGYYVDDQFTPEMEVFEGVVSRWKCFKDDSYVFDEISLYNSIQNAKRYHDELADLFMATQLRKVYLGKYAKAPHSIAIDPKLFKIEVMEDRLIRVEFRLPGVIDQEKTEEIFVDVYSLPVIETHSDTEKMSELLKQIATDIKEYFAGSEKEKNGKEGKDGLCPRKNHATHGLKVNIDKHPRRMELAEAQSLYIIKKAIKHSTKPIVSSSFGNDSILTYHLVNKVVPGMESAYINTGVEYGAEITKVRKEFLDFYDVDSSKVHMLRPDTTYWEIQEEYGWNFGRKGDRRKKRGKKVNNVSEVCCYKLKHEPFFKATKEKGWDTNFTGTRGPESRARDLAGKRDGAYYHSSTWNQMRVNPILFWTNDMTWEYVKAHNIPYADVYDMVLYDEEGNKKYSPRVGCWSCALNAKNGYFEWLREFKPKMYRFLMKEKGLSELLFRLHLNLPLETTKKGGYTTRKAQMTMFDQQQEDFSPDQALWWIENRPCKVEDVLTQL